MLRSLLLGKLSLSIIVSLVLGAICASQPWRGNYSLSQSVSWFGVGLFFLLLGMAQLAAVYLLFRKKQFSQS